MIHSELPIDREVLAKKKVWMNNHSYRMTTHYVKTLKRVEGLWILKAACGFIAGFHDKPVLVGSDGVVPKCKRCLKSRMTETTVIEYATK